MLQSTVEKCRCVSSIIYQQHSLENRLHSKTLDISGFQSRFLQVPDADVILAFKTVSCLNKGW